MENELRQRLIKELTKSQGIICNNTILLNTIEESVRSSEVLKVAMLHGRIEAKMIKLSDMLLENMPREVVTFQSGFEGMEPDIKFIETRDPPCKPSKMRKIAELHKKEMLKGNC